MITATKAPERPSALSTRREIIEAIEAAHEVGVEYWSQFSTGEFFAPVGAAWSPAEHVRHLTRSMTPLLPVLRVPRVALRVMFGSATVQSRSYAGSAAYRICASARRGRDGGSVSRRRLIARARRCASRSRSWTHTPKRCVA